jgi:hypothetical protein
MYNKHRVLIIKLTGRSLGSMLSKLRATKNVDPGEYGMNKILDTYTRLYLSGAKISQMPPVRKSDALIGQRR